jgi:hypothetical protein
MASKFTGDLEALKALVDKCGIKGTWEVRDNGHHQYRTPTQLVGDQGDPELFWAMTGSWFLSAWSRGPLTATATASIMVHPGELLPEATVPGGNAT